MAGEISSLGVETSWATDDYIEFVDDSDTSMSASGTNKQITLGNAFANFSAERTGSIVNTWYSSDNNAVQIRLRTDSSNRRIIAADGAGTAETQIQMLDAGVSIYGASGSSGAYLRLLSFDDAGRPSAVTVGAGAIIFNSDDGQLNISDGTNWTLPDGTTT